MGQSAYPERVILGRDGPRFELWRPTVEKWIPLRRKPARSASAGHGFASLRLGESGRVDIEARARLSSLREFCGDERQVLENLQDPRLAGVLEAISRLQAEIAAALASLHAPDADV
jgi:hypothetical protein